MRAGPPGNKGLPLIHVQWSREVQADELHKLKGYRRELGAAPVSEEYYLEGDTMDGEPIDAAPGAYGDGAAILPTTAPVGLYSDGHVLLGGLGGRPGSLRARIAPGPAPRPHPQDARPTSRPEGTAAELFLRLRRYWPWFRRRSPYLANSRAACQQP